MKLKLAVIFGGESVEHEISIISATQAMAALNRERYDLVPIYLSKDHRFYNDPRLSDIKAYEDLKRLLSQVPEVTFKRLKHDVVIQPLHGLFKKPQKLDLALPIVHGTYSEDGTLVGFLETLGLPYIGSDGIASAVAQDKAFMKMAFAHAGLPILPWLEVFEPEFLQDPQSVHQKVKKLGYPIIVKPARLGSSIGIQIVHNADELNQALDLAFRFDAKVVLEVLVQALREINCSVLGDGVNTQASVLEEVTKQDAILSFKDKYEGGSKGKGMASLDRIIPAPVDQELTQKIQDMAQSAFRCLGSQGVARIDFILDAKTQALYVNEINTIPGSLSFYLWDKSGLNFTALLDRLVEQGIHAQRQRSKRLTSFDTNILAKASSRSKLGKK